MFSLSESGDDRPCFPMRGLLSRLSDGSASRFGRWCISRHVAGCQRCGAALESLIVLQFRLRSMSPADSAEEPGVLLPLEARERLRHALDELDGAA